MMLRTLVLVAALIAFTAAVVVVVIVPLQWPLLVWSGIALAGILFERGRYGAAQPRPIGEGWRETSERFVNDASGRVMVVWYHPASGQRQYVAEDVGINALANDVQ